MTTPSRPERTFFLLVTCSREESRRKMAVTVTNNVVDKLSKIGLIDRLIVFDNASIYLDHLAFLPSGVQVCKSECNIGYWSAIKWVLERHKELVIAPCDFIYIIESDLVHKDFSPLARCEKFLDMMPNTSSVRTQEFSVKLRWRYDKRLQFLPFHVERSQVSLRNAITQKKAWFKLYKETPEIYVSNLHPKLPSIHRLSYIKQVFDALSGKDEFSEADYFFESMNISSLIGVLDGGIYHSLSTFSDQDSVISGSYSTGKQLDELGYLPTRVCKIVDSSKVNVSFSKF